MSFSNKVPVHIAIVMDGNGRWAKQRFLPRKLGHSKGVGALRNCVENCIKQGVQILTVFAFSSENWQRDDDEVDALLSLLTSSLPKEVPGFIEKGIQLHFIGSTERVKAEIQQQLIDAQSATAKGNKFIFNVCFNYGGRWDIVQAMQKLRLSQQAITEKNIAAALALAHVPDPDLVIRTGGEQRLSNFLLWQSAYAELYFSDKLWPEFDIKELDNAIDWYSKRERRFGKTTEQLKNKN